MLKIATDDGSVVALGSGQVVPAACGSQVSIELLRLLARAIAAEWESMPGTPKRRREGG